MRRLSQMQVGKEESLAEFACFCGRSTWLKEEWPERISTRANSSFAKQPHAQGMENVILQ